MTTPTQTLQTLAHLHPDYPTFTAALPPELTHPQAPLPEGLAADVLALLIEEQPELQSWLEARQSAPPDKLLLDPLQVHELIAILFLLRSRIKFERAKDGRWSLSWALEPNGAGLIKTIWDKLSTLFGGKD